MVAKNTYSSVEEMIRSTTDDPAFAGEESSHLAERMIVSNLFALRNSKGFSQADMAKKMKCSQSRISKLENGTDNDLRLGDFAEYLHSLEFDVKILVQRQGNTLVDELKYHVFSIKKIMDRLAALASGDGSMVRGVLHLIKATAQGIECFLREAANGLTLPDESAVHPRISIEVEDEADESMADSNCRDVAKRFGGILVVGR